MKYAALILIATAFVSCSNLGRLIDKEKSDSYFITSDGQISYCQNGNWFELGSTKVNADAKSFKVLSTEVAEDKNFVFCCGYPQKQVNRNTFYIKNNIPRDSFHVYNVVDVGGSDIFSIIEGADPTTFEYLDSNSNWARDKDHYFFDSKKLNVDRKTFALINKTFSEDKDSVYIITESGDFKSVLQNTRDSKAVNNNYMQKGKVIYYLAYHPDPKLSADSFESIDKIRIVDDDIICVNNQVISYGKKFKYDNVDANSFQLFPPDQQQVVNDLYSKDKNNVYYNGEIITGADVKTYSPLGFGFGKDAKHAYYETKLLKGVDSKSFKESDDSVFHFEDKLGNKFDYNTGKKL